MHGAVVLLRGGTHLAYRITLAVTLKQQRNVRRTLSTGRRYRVLKVANSNSVCKSRRGFLISRGALWKARTVVDFHRRRFGRIHYRAAGNRIVDGAVSWRSQVLGIS